VYYVNCMSVWIEGGGISSTNYGVYGTHVNFDFATGGSDTS